MASLVWAAGCLFPGAGQTAQLGQECLGQPLMPLCVGVQLVVLLVAEVLPLAGHGGKQTAERVYVDDRNSPHMGGFGNGIHIMVYIEALFVAVILAGLPVAVAEEGISAVQGSEQDNLCLLYTSPSPRD